MIVLVGDVKLKHKPFCYLDIIYLLHMCINLSAFALSYCVGGKKKEVIDSR